MFFEDGKKVEVKETGQVIQVLLSKKKFISTFLLVHTKLQRISTFLLVHTKLLFTCYILKIHATLLCGKIKVSNLL